MISEKTNDTVTDYTYGLERISASTGRARTEYVYDGRGSVIGEVTKSGLLSSAKVTTTAYTPFGEQIGEKTSGFGWNGEYFNAATGQVYLRARFYEPEMNRFSQKDILRGSTANAITQNRYLYCINDPLNFVDPSGKALGLLAGTAIAAGLCGLVAGATSAYQSYKSTGKVDWKQAGKAAVGGVTAAVAVGVAVATGGTGLGVATMVVEAVAGGRTALRGGNAADVTTSMAKGGVTTVIAGNVLPVLPNVAKAVIGTAGATGGVVKTVNDTKAASNTFKDPNATTLDKINAVVDVAIDVTGTIGSAAYAYSGISGMIANAKAAGTANRLKSPTADNPKVESPSSRPLTSCANENERLRVGEPVDPIEKTLDMALDPESYAYAVAEKYGINLRSGGTEITIRYDPNLPLGNPGKTIITNPTEIIVGPSAFANESELANTIAHELNHARSWLNGGIAPEDSAYAAGDALSEYIGGLR